MPGVPFFTYIQHEQGQSWEWIDGSLEELPPLTPDQLYIKKYLLSLVGEYVEVNELGLVIPGPFIVRMPEEMHRGREPDLLFLPNEYVEAIEDNYVNSHGVGLVVEISGAKTRDRDHADKYDEYQMAGIPEYWIFDTERRQAYFYVLREDNHYHAVEPDEKEVYHSTIIRGFELQVGSVWMNNRNPNEIP